MSKLIARSCLTGAAALMIVVSTSAIAMPEKPLNAAQVQTQKDREDVGCYVSEIGGGDISVYEYDPDCNSHIVRKDDKDGNFVSYRYQDKGDLQPGQTPPDSTTRNSWSSGICDFTEVITPSGSYSSTADCKS